MKIRVSAILLSIMLASGAGSAFAAPAWAIDTNEVGTPEAGEILGCLELSCHGDVPLVVDGEPRIVHVEAFLDGPVAKLAFADQGTPPFAFQFTQSEPLRITLRPGLVKAAVTLLPPDSDEPGVINPLYHSKPLLASLNVVIKIVGYWPNHAPSREPVCPHCVKPINSEQ
jgi:hypothetical protein